MNSWQYPLMLWCALYALGCFALVYRKTRYMRGWKR